MERLVLVHGSVVNGETTWAAQAPSRERYELVGLAVPPNPLHSTATADRRLRRLLARS